MSASEPVPRHGPDIFLSYRRTDKEFVGKLVPVLESLGPSVWWDAEIEGGEDWRDAIVEHLAASRCLVIVFSEACNTSKQLKKELAVADHLDKDVIPVLIEPTEPRGFFLYELAPLQWICIHPTPMEKLDSVARLLVERLEEAGWTVPVVAPAELEPLQLAAATDGAAAAESLSVPVQPPSEPLAAPLPPEPDAEARVSDVLTPPAPPEEDHAQPRATGAMAATLPSPPSPTASGVLPTPPDPPRRGLGDIFPFRWVDFILPTVAGLLMLFDTEDDAVGIIVGDALVIFVTTLAITGLIVFPIRYYRRQSNPHRVGRNLVISNVVFALVAGVGGFLTAESLVEEGETVSQVRAEVAFGYVIFGLLFAALSFLIFVVLSRIRARKAYKQSIVRL